MKKNLLVMVTGIVFLFYLVSCVTKNLDNYEPASKQEKEVVGVITNAQDAWKMNDANQFVAEFCPDGVFAYRILSSNRGDKRQVSRDAIPAIFSEAHDSMGDTYDLENPKISISEDKAVIAARKPGDGYYWPVKIQLTRESNEWCIDDWDFNFYF